MMAKTDRKSQNATDRYRTNASLLQSKVNQSCPPHFAQRVFLRLMQIRRVRQWFCEGNCAEWRRRTRVDDPSPEGLTAWMRRGWALPIPRPYPDLDGMPFPTLYLYCPPTFWTWRRTYQSFYSFVNAQA